MLRRLWSMAAASPRRVFCLVLCMACREDAPIDARGVGGTGGAETGQCVGIGHAGGATAPICSADECQAEAFRQSFNGCFVCRGLACEPDDTCAASGHSNGPAQTGCSCRDGRYECWIRRNEPTGVGGGGAACQETIAASPSTHSCLDCSGISCNPSDVCLLSLPDGGAGLSRCSCVEGEFSCSVGPPGTSGSGDAGQW